LRSFPWLSLTTFLPLAGVAGLALVPKARANAARLLALVVSLLVFASSVVVLALFRPGEAGFQLVERAWWIRSLGIRYEMGVDGISLFLVVLTTFLLPLCVLASWKETRSVRTFMALLLVLESAMVGVFLATDLFLFYVFWEFVLIPMYFVIGGWGSERRVYAAVKFFLFTLAGGLLMLVGILVLYFLHRNATGIASFSYESLRGLHLSLGSQRWLFLAFFAAFAVKVPLVPLHTWLPDAHTEAPTAGSVILAGVLLKMGTYGFLRFSLPLFPRAAKELVPLLSILAIVGILYGGVIAVMQRDLKRLVAYSSVSHLGFIVLGTFALTTQAMQGGVLYMVNHGLSTGALFLLVGMLYERRHSRMISDFGGAAAVVPVLAGFFLITALSSMALPGLNGFVGEFLVLLGTFLANRVYAVLAAGGVILAAVYLLWAYQRVMHGPVSNEQTRRMKDLSVREIAILVPLVTAMIFIGVYPRPLLSRMQPSVDRVIEIVTEANSSSALPSR